MPNLTLDPANPVAISPQDDAIITQTVQGLMSQAEIQMLKQTMATQMTEAVMKKDILTNVGNLTGTLMGSVADAFDVNPDKIAAAFKFDLSEEELQRIMSAMMSSNEKKSAVSNLSQLGYQNIEEPTNMSFYFNSFDAKERFVEFIDEYNEEVEDKNEDEIIRYTDLTGILMSSVKTIVNSVTYVLIAFVSISLVVSSIMIGIITYISVFERTKEIGILRAIGASKGNISSIFNAETFIIGLLSGSFGIGVTLLLIPIINLVIHNVTGNMDINAVLPLEGGITLLILSIILTIIGGLIPSHSASKKDPVVALRTE
jgi:ABC-type antimicrobial peptide transport system permease subunit